jgi:regulator of RNase E activity RraA
VVDDDGATVIPAALIGEVVEIAPEQERLENWIMQEVEKGTPLPGLYPPNDEAMARYAATKNL